MPTEAPAPTVARPPAATAGVAARAAERCWEANRRGLSARQPGQALALAGCDPDVTWATARDGSPWARDAAGRWLAGCSVPVLAGRALLRSLAVEPGGHCLLAPAHAGLVAATRERLGPGPVLFVVQPDLATCRAILACHDCSADLAAGRTWFFAGEAWADALGDALERYPGLALPARFVRTRLTPDAAVEPLVTAAQAVMGRVATARAADLTRRAAAPRPLDRGRAVVVAGAAGLGSVGSDPLRDAAAAAGLAVTAYNTADPMTSSPSALAAAVAGCGYVLAVDLGRADAAAVGSAGATWVTWVTWVTRAAVPACPGGGTDDHLVLADADWRPAAARAGWPAGRVHVGACPPLVPAAAPPPVPTLGLLADTAAVVLPDRLRDFSSQQLLWDDIAAELHGDPLAATATDAYLDDRAEQFNIAPGQVDRRLFADRLIGPAYVQGLARLLVGGGLPLRLWGEGWAALPEFRPHAGGPIRSPAAFADAVAGSTALVRPQASTGWHPVDACGRPTLAADRRPATYRARAAALLRSTTRPPARSGPTLSDAVAAIVEGGRSTSLSGEPV